ncbi:MAG: tryptophan--tRNA ligase, partial [Calditrichaeota bacterium]
DGQKMSKSYENTIEMFLDKKPLKKKVMGIVTDSKALEEPKDPDKSTIVDLYKLFATKDELQAMRDNFLAGGYGYGHAKKELLEKIWTHFEEARNRRKELSDNLDYVRDVLRNGAEKAHVRADVVMKRVRDAVGIEKFFV